MKWVTLKVIFRAADPALAQELIADAFYGVGARGVVIEEPFLSPSEDWAHETVLPAAADAVIAYLPMDSRIDARRRVLKQSLQRLARREPIEFQVQTECIDEEDWAHAWKAHFKPLRIGRRFLVTPTWHPVAASSGRIVLQIDPGMAFGTGTHATTAGCLLALEKHLKQGEAVLDVGTGSGILLTAAAKLGAGRLWGTDTDETALAVASANLRLNGIPSSRFRLSMGDLLVGVTDCYDLVVANILTAEILRMIPALPAVLKPRGRFICSGIPADSASTVLSRLIGRGYEIIDRQTREQWAIIVGRRGPGPASGKASEDGDA